MPQLVTVGQQGSCAICTLNLPEKRNPISRPMRDALRSALEQIRAQAEARAVILTGAGSAFCSGLDLEALAAVSGQSAAESQADSESIREFFQYLWTYPKPTIAAVNGPAMAGGCAVALLCDLTLAGSDACFCFSEVRLGFVPALAGVYLERLAGPKVARDLLLTARRVPAAEALGLGLINAVVPPERLMAEALDKGEEIARNSPSALSSTKELLGRLPGLSFDEGLRAAADLNAQARGTSDCLEGVSAFLQKRTPKWVK